MIKEIFFTGFRNLSDRKIKLSSNFNLIYGENAQGKTSFIEAIYFAATGKSFRTRKNKEMIKYDLDESTVYIKLNNMSSYSINLSKIEKKYFKNGDKIKYTEYIGDILAISFIPEDVELITGNPSIRRAFFNYEISQIDKEYLKNIINYEKILKIRNKLIKEKKHKEKIFEIYNQKYIELNLKILKIREEYIDRLNKYLSENYKKIFYLEQDLNILYDNFLKIKKYDEEKCYEKLEKLLNDKLEYEVNLGYSIYGIHKDEYIFNLNSKNARHYSSQGEKKSIIFIIKISEIEIMQEKINRKPIFLMDDLNSFFDNFRKNQIINYFIEKDIQFFLTATEDLKIVGKKYYLDKGEIYD